MRKGCRGHFKIAILLQFFDQTSFRAKGLPPKFLNRNSISVFSDRTSFRAKRLPPKLVISQFYFSFWRSNLISCERVVADISKSQFYLISCEKVAAEVVKSQFYLSFWRSNLISCEKVAAEVGNIAILLQFLVIEPRFVRKGCVSCRPVGTAPRLQERNRKEGESKRAREQEGKRARGQERM